MHMARNVRLSLLALAVFAAPLLNSSAVHAFSNATLRGSYGCLGSLFFVGSTSSGAPASGEISAVEQLSFNSAGAVTGSLRLQISGEDCSGTVASGSTYSVGANGIGSLSLNFTFTTDPVDRDVNCTGLTLLKPTKLDLVIQENGEQFAFAGQDDLFSAASDGGDIGPGSFKGTCVSQTSP